MGCGLSDLQKRILVAVHRLETPVCRADDLRAGVRDVAQHIYGDAAKTGTNRATFARAITRLEERGLLQRCYPGLSLTGDPKTRWLILTEEARTAYRLTRGHGDPKLTDSARQSCDAPTATGRRPRAETTRPAHEVI